MAYIAFDHVTKGFSGRKVLEDCSFSVEKGESEGRTFTAVEKLSRERRRGELARLTSGDLMTQTALRGAEEMLAQAEQYQKGE